MSHLSAITKHHILLEYSPDRASQSFAALALRHGVAGGARTVQRWHEQWTGDAASMERKKGTGRARTLTPAEVSRHVRAPILAANRAHRAIHYTDLLPSVQQISGKEVALRTLQRYGHDELDARNKTTKKRTAAESK